MKPIHIATVALSVCACGSAPTRVSVTPMTPAHEVAFDNGVDLIADPSILEGSWLEDWEREIDERVRLSDAVALVRVTTVRHDTDLEQHDTYRLFVEVERVRHGAVAANELSLSVESRAAGFATVRDNESRILNQRFVGFLKWVQDPSGGPIAARWHLSPASERVVRRVNSLVEESHSDEDSRRRVIVREQSN